MGQRAERKQRGLRSGLLIALAMMSVIACTKKKELKNEVSPEPYMDTGVFGTMSYTGGKSTFAGKTFHLIRGIEEADSHNTIEAIPGDHEDFGLVTVRITEDELQLLKAFDVRGRDETAQIVASYPITDHFDIQREENDYKEQTNKIVENREKPWQERRYIRVDWSKPSNSSSSLSSQVSKMYARLVKTLKGKSGGPMAAGDGADGSGSSIAEENTVLLEDAKIENGHISWLTETSLSDGGRPYIPVTSDNWEKAYGYRVTYRTHLMPVKASDFKPVPYTAKDFARFGYFYTEQDFEHPEKGLLDAGIKKYANVFNVCEKGQSGSCATNKIVWVVNKEFPERYLATTRKVVKAWNETFKTALGRTDDVVVFDEATRPSLSDPRYNIIGFYEPAAVGGLLGKAQSVQDPRTGETIAARASVYQDGINYVLGQVDEIIDEIVKDPGLRDQLVGGEQTTAVESKGGKSVKSAGRLSGRELRSSMKAMMETLGVKSIRQQKTLKEPAQIVKAALNRGAGTRTLNRKLDLIKKDPSSFSFAELQNLDGSLDESLAIQSGASELKGFDSLLAVGQSIRAEQKLALIRAEKGIHGYEFVEDAALRYLQKILEKTKASDLAAKRAAIREEIAQLTFYTTLLHEMGHNFGLRHNFQGSADEPNYTKEYFELKARLAKQDPSVQEADLDPYAYSSIMDYGAEFYAQSAGLGPYDNAAIKYAYNRSIDRETDAVTQRGYAFCTDDQVIVNESLLCRRFDKGRNATEIVQNMIESYWRDFKLVHIRRGRANFERIARRYPSWQLQRTFLPVRQAIDELNYAFRAAPTEIDAETNCSAKFVTDSVKSGEIANVCDELAAEEGGVDPTDMSTFFMGLMKADGSGEFRVDPGTYKPYGLADLVLASTLAQQFFARVIGLPEPGSYLVMPNQDQTSASLIRLPDEGSDLEKVTTLAQKNNIAKPDEWAKKRVGLVTDIEEGRSAGYLESVWENEGIANKRQRIGTLWDKIIAIVALGTRDLGVQKYDLVSMAGNAYMYPTSSKQTSKLFERMITLNPRIVAVPVRTRSGHLVQAVAPAALSIDIQAQATLVAFTDFVFDNDTSEIDKLRICNLNEGACAANFGLESVDYVSALGSDKFRAVQTLDNDSYSFLLVSQAKEIADRRQKALDTVNNWPKKQAELLKTLENAETVRARIHENLAKAGLQELQAQVTDTSKEASSAWAILLVMSKETESVQLFHFLTLVDQVNGAFAGASAIVDQRIAEINVCTGDGDDAGVNKDADACKGLVDKSKKTRKALAQLQTDLKSLSEIVANSLDAGVAAKTAPLGLDNSIDSLKRTESQIRFIRKLFKEDSRD
jgi:hypothetical protein